MIQASVLCDYFPYPVKDYERMTYEVLADTWEIKRELSWRKVSEEVLQRPYGTLSPGEQMKILLARFF